MLRPNSFAKRLADISLTQLAAQGTRGLIIDLDNTLVGYRQKHPAQEDAAWVTQALANGVRIVVVSNNVEAWVKEVAGGLRISFIHKARKPLPSSFKKALQLLETSRAETVVIGDQLFTDVLGAKWCGLKVILVDPIVADEHPAMRALRMLERLILPHRG